MRVSVCQMDPRPDALTESMAAVGRHAADEDTDLLLLPEMPFSEWLAAERAVDPERWVAAVLLHDEWIERLGDLGVGVVLGTRPIVDDAGGRRNEAFVWTASDSTAVPLHQKHYLPDEPGYWEASWYERGPRRFETARAGDALVGVQICTELWFLDWARHYAREGVDVLVTPRATPRSSVDRWIAGGRVAAICSGAYSLSSNLWEPPGRSPADLGGVGWVVDPDGEVLATTSSDRPCVTVDIDLEVARRSKSTYPRYVEE